ncbi:MAG: hypothetical protein ACREV1_01350 [Gammaproteobacteria bacterium]
MKQAQFPRDWDDERVNRVLGHYESQAEEEASAIANLTNATSA